MFDINLATRIYINARRVKFFTFTVMGVLIGLLFVAIGNIAGKAAETKRLTHEIAVLDDKYKAVNKGVPEKEYKKLLERISFANGIIDKKRYNWLTLLDKLEVVVPEGVAISSVEPNVKDNSLKLPGIARSFKHLTTLMERLENSPLFTEVYLNSQAETTFEDKTKGIAFTVTCKVTNK